MTTSAPLTDASVAARVSAVQVSAEALVLELADGLTVSVPLAWYPRLLAGSIVERKHLELIGEGEGVHWPDLDEDLGVESVLAGRPPVESLESFRRWLRARASHGAAQRRAPANGTWWSVFHSNPHPPRHGPSLSFRRQGFPSSPVNKSHSDPC